MFSWQHFVWLGISIFLIVLCFYLFRFKTHLKLSTFLYISAGFVFLQEMIQMFGMMDFLPYAQGNEHNVGGITHYAPYFDPRDFPLHLCSIQFIFLYIAARSKNEKKQKQILSFFFPTAIFGASVALILSNVFTLKNEPGWMDKCFISPIYYSFFLIHSYLLFAGLFIMTDKRLDFHFKDSFYGIKMMYFLGCLSLMVNSMFTVVRRDPNNVLKPVEIISNANLFFTTDIPLDIVITEKWQWILYFLILALIIPCVFFAFFLPFYLKDRKKKIEQPVQAEVKMETTENEQESHL